MGESHESFTDVPLTREDMEMSDFEVSDFPSVDTEKTDVCHYFINDDNASEVLKFEKIVPDENKDSLFFKMSFVFFLGMLLFLVVTAVAFLVIVIVIAFKDPDQLRDNFFSENFLFST